MREIITSFGKNAGKIWNTLKKSGPLTETNLLSKSRLSHNDLHAAIGWLARENKIVREGNKYRLGETNLTGSIGTNAGKLWQTLDSQGDIDVSTIAELNNIDLKDAYSALGWLARENKVHAKKTTEKKGRLLVRLK